MFTDPEAGYPDALNFGIFDSDAAPVSQSFQLFNNGLTNALEVTETSITGPGAAAFTAVQTPDSLGPEECGTVEVRLDPSGFTGSIEATLEMTTNNVSNTVLSIALSALVQDASGLLAHYPMDETDGDTLTDVSPNGFDGTYTASGESAFQLGQPPLAAGTAVTLAPDGSGNAAYAEIPDVLIPSLHDFSASMWVFLDARDDGGAGTLFSKGTQGIPFSLVRFADTEPGRLAWLVSGNEVIVTDDIITSETAYHVVLAQSDATGAPETRLYIDGVLVGKGRMEAELTWIRRRRVSTSAPRFSMTWPTSA